MTNEHAGHNPVFIENEHDGNETIWLMGLVSWKTQFLLFMIMDGMKFLGMVSWQYFSFTFGSTVNTNNFLY